MLSTPLWAVGVAAMRPDSTTVSLPVYALGLAAVMVAASILAGRSYAAMVAVRADEPDPVRRRLVTAGWIGVAGMVLGWAELGRLLFPRPDPGRLPLRAASVTPTAPPSPAPGDAVFARISALAPRITSNDAFYVVDEEIVDPDIDPVAWRLRVGGAVDAPFELTYDELLAMPAIERFQTLECISNPTGGDLISTAKWTGVPMHSLLERARPTAGALEVVSRAVGGYSDSIPLAQAMLPTTLVAFGMNGRELPRHHGFPARLLVPGLYGMKQPKWLQEIEVVERPYTGYWEARGWIKAAVVKTTARVDTFGARAAPYTIAGVAFAGDRGISKVEVSTDGGSSWEEAQLETELAADTWRRWALPFSPSGSGPFDVVARATDGNGATQTRAVAPPHPSGATGYDEVVLGGS